MAKSPRADATQWSFEVNKDALIRLQIRTEKLEHTSRRLGLVLKLIALAIIIFLIFEISRNVLRSSEIVIDNFDVAPSVGGGLTGEVVARRIRNQLTLMRLNTGSRESVEDVREPNWLEDSRITIPQTGMTIGALSGEFRRWLGRDTRIRGEIYRAGDKLTLFVRTRDANETFEDPDINALVRLAAEWIFERTDRFHFAMYLSNNRRRQDSARQLAALVTGGTDAVERAWALNGLGAHILDFRGDCAAAIPILEEAARLNPDLPTIQGNLSNAHYCLGHDQAAASATLREMQLLGANPGQLGSDRIEQLLLEDRDNLAGSVGDYRGRLALYEAMEKAGLGDQRRRHALALAELRETRESISAILRWYAIRRWDPNFAEYSHHFWNVLFTQAWALGSWREAALFIQRANDDLAATNDRYERAQLRTQSLPLQVMALARTDEVERAAQIAAALPEDCYLCIRSRATVAEMQDNDAEVDRWFRRAIRLGPRLPFAYAEYGEALLRRDEPARALRLFERALVHGPEFVDAHKGRGDALRALRRDAEAVQAYEAAGRRAPRWGALRLAWARALWRVGRPQEARANLCAARDMDFNRMDRALFGRLMAAARIRSC